MLKLFWEDGQEKETVTLSCLGRNWAFPHLHRTKMKYPCAHTYTPDPTPAGQTPSSRLCT